MDYDKIYKNLSNIKKNRSNINFYNLDDYVNGIINLCLKDNINFKNLELIHKLNEIKIYPEIFKNNTIEYFKYFYIIPEKIKDTITKFEFINKSILFEPKNLFIKNNNIYLIDNNKVSIIYFDKNFLFVTKLIFYYDDIKLLELEKKELTSNSKEEYIKLRGCKENNYNIQPLIKDNKKIGSVLILNEISRNKPNKNYIINNTNYISNINESNNTIKEDNKLNKQIKELSKKNEEKNEEINKINKNFEIINKVKEVLKKEKEDILNKLEENKNEMNKNKNLYEGKNKELLNEIEKMKIKIIELEKDNNKKENEIKDLKLNNANIIKELENKTKEIINSNENKNKINKELKNKETELKNIKEENNKLITEKNELINILNQNKNEI